MGMLIREVNRKNLFEPTCYEDLVNQSRKNPINGAIFNLITGCCLLFWGGREMVTSTFNLSRYEMKANDAFLKRFWCSLMGKKGNGLNLPCSNDHLKQRLHDINGSHLHMCARVLGGGRSLNTSNSAPKLFL
jgi:hypothetical protein